MTSTARANPEAVSGGRKLHHSKGHHHYLIFYRIQADTVQVLHVLHGAMDYERILFPED